MAAAALCFKTFLLLSLLLLPLSYGNMVDSSFHHQDGVQQAKYSPEKGDIFQMKPISRKLLNAGAMLDYDDTGANTKHDPKRKPGKP